MKFHIPTIGDYEQFIGAETVDRIQAKTERLKNTRVVNLNSTYYGGGVAELLSGLTLLMNTRETVKEGPFFPGIWNSILTFSYQSRPASLIRRGNPL